MLCHMFGRKKKGGRDNRDKNIFVNHQLTSVESAQDQKIFLSNWFNENQTLIEKDFNYLFSLIEKCLNLCIKPEINFKTNPPYLPSLLRNFNTKIRSIVKCYEHNLSELSNNCFFRVSIWTLMKQCKEIVGIFRKSTKKSIKWDELSQPRQKLINISFLLSHLFHSLVALFPGCYYSPESFRITKSDAEEWWHRHFGPSTTVVKWRDFFHVFSKFSTFWGDVKQVAALKRSINVTGSGFVSIFDFDVFVRLFQPWSKIGESWKIILVDHPGCMPLLTYEQVVQLLRSFRYHPGAGSYVFRFSCTKPGQWAIGYIDVSGKIFQTIVHNKSIAVALNEGEKAGLYKFPNGIIFDSSQIRSLSSLPRQNIVVSQEEHEAYCRIDSSFEICKICELNHKNVRLEPCGHLLCDFCLNKWQKSFRYQGCPFCRFQIKDTERVSLVPFKPDKLGEANESSLIRRDCPAVPPRFSSIIDSPLKLNYAKLDWLSLNDSGYGAYTNYGDDDVNVDNCDGDRGTLVKSFHNIHYQNTVNYLDNDNTTACSTSSNSNNDNTLNTLKQQQHITDGDDDDDSKAVAMKQLLKITNNDLTMSRKILRYFELRSVAVGT